MSSHTQTKTTFSVDTIPAMPIVAAKIMKLLSNTDVSVQDIADVISIDQAIAAKVLQVANSPFYGLARKVQNIKQAIVIMGLSGIKSIVIAVSTKNVYKHPGLLENLLWEHSVGSGMAAFLIAKHSKKVLSDDAFIGGLLHDIGKPIMHHLQRDQFHKLMQTSYNENFTITQYLEAEKEMFGITHMDIGAMAIKKWQLSKDILLATQTHHVLEPQESRQGGDLFFWACVTLANLFCHHLGIGMRDKDQSVNLENCLPTAVLSLPPSDMEILLEQTQTSFEEEMSSFTF